MAGFEPWISGVGSEHYANCTTTMPLGQCDQMARLFVHFFGHLQQWKYAQSHIQFAKADLKYCPMKNKSLNKSQSLLKSPHWVTLAVTNPLFTFLWKDSNPFKRHPFPVSFSLNSAFQGPIPQNFFVCNLWPNGYNLWNILCKNYGHNLQAKIRTCNLQSCEVLWNGPLVV